MNESRMFTIADSLFIPYNMDKFFDIVSKFLAGN